MLKMTKKQTEVLIAGGGFAGIKAALDLSGHDQFSVSLVSEQDNFRYYPTLYHAATGGRVTAAQIPLTEIFKDKPVRIIRDSLQSVDREAKKASGKAGDYPYDVIVLALGVVTNYFGIKGLEKYSYGIKSIEDAGELRDHIHKVLMDEGKPDQNYVVIGGGPTGVELAGALPGYIRHVMKMHGIPSKKLHIDLVEAAPRLMPRMPKDYSKAVARRLRRLGIKLYLNEAVQAETADGLVLKDHSIDSHTVVWTAGVTNHPFFDKNKFAFGEHGKVAVDDFLQAETDVFVIGDNAETLYSGMAQTALHDAKFVSSNLIRHSQGKRMRRYRPKKPVYVTPAGPGWAAVLWRGVHIYGWLGWALRSAADFVGYHDYDPWWTASRHWIAEYQTEDNCPVCAGLQKAV
jgi:NADH dehydrogenase